MSKKTVTLIIGLGNPGDKYSKTRHNAGFWFIDALANHYNATFKAENKFSGEVARATIEGHQVWLLKPSTFMNRSGLSAHQLSSFYKIPVGQILVAYDELDLSPGVVRLKQGGGHGGHNGLRDLHAQIGKDYLRLRFGIGHPGDKRKVADYVLSRPGQNDEIAINHAIDRALGEMEKIIVGDHQKVMNILHAD